MASNEPPSQYATTGFIIDHGTIVEKDMGKPFPAPGAKRAIATLQKHKTPFAIVTRDISMTEEERSRDLTKQLDLPISEKSIILPHTPFRAFVPLYKDKPILVVGGEPARDVATSYGYTHVLTPKDITTLYTHIYRTHPPTCFTTTTSATSTTPTKTPPSIPSSGDRTPLRIAAIFIFWTTRHWELDMRIVTDVLMSQAGYVGTHSRANLSHLDNAPEQQPPLYVSGAEVTGRYGRAVPRREGEDWLGCLEARWARVTRGKELGYEVLGGMGCDEVTVGWADGVLEEGARALDGREMGPSGRAVLETVYMVGGEIWFGAESERMAVLFDPEARRRTIKVDPGKSGHLWSVLSFEAQTRPHHVSASLEEAVEYALDKEHRYCLKRGVEPLFPATLR